MEANRQWPNPTTPSRLLHLKDRIVLKQAFDYSSCCWIALNTLGANLRCDSARLYNLLKFDTYLSIHTCRPLHGQCRVLAFLLLGRKQNTGWPVLSLSKVFLALTYTGTRQRQVNSSWTVNGSQHARIVALRNSTKLVDFTIKKCQNRTTGEKKSLWIIE